MANPYDAALTPALYDGLIATMFSPLGGIGRGYGGDLTACGYRPSAPQPLARGCAQFLTAMVA